MTTSRSDHYELPFADVERIEPRCPQCGEPYLFKVRPCAVPFDVNKCFCGHMFEVDPSQEPRHG